MHAIIGGGERRREEEDGRGEWTVELTLPLYNGPENARIRVQIYGLCGRGRERERERTIANLRCLVWSIAVERRVESAPAWYAHAGRRKGEGSNRQLRRERREGGRGEALYSRKFERDRKGRRRLAV